MGWAYFWLCAAVVLMAVEAATVALIAVWFAIGSAGALITAILGGGFIMQMVLFIVCSALSLAIIRPMAVRRVNGRTEPTNCDRIIGREAAVIETVDNLKGTGAVRVNGLTWTARSTDGSRVPKGSTAVITAIEGVKVLVVPAGKKNRNVNNNKGGRTYDENSGNFDNRNNNPDRYSVKYQGGKAVGSRGR